MSALRLVSRVAAIGLVAVAACVRDARFPSEPAMRRTPQFAAVASSRVVTALAPTGRHIVSFNGQVRSDFAQQVAALGGKVLWVSTGSGLAAVSGLRGNAPALLGGKRGIQAVDVDQGIPLDVPRIAAETAADGGGVASNANPAAAVRYTRQWNMRAVQADVAWAHGVLGSSSVSIFMLDSGIDPHHADTEGRVDATRSVDLLGTFETQLDDGTTVPFTEADTVQKYFPGHEVYTDLFFHGTHTGATVSSNAVRAAGVTSGTMLVAVKVCGYINECPFTSILFGVIYAANSGADVVNLSLGGAFTKAGNGRFVGLLNKVFNFARSRGVTVVVSAGNGAADLDHDGNTYWSFCNTPSVICVAATGPTSDANATNPNPNLARAGPFTDVDAPAYLADPVQELHDATTDILRRTLSGDELERITSWWDELRADERFRMFEPRLRHGDLWYENLLVADGRLVGVIDWGTAEYGDPAEDFDALRHISDEFADAVLASYPHADPDLRYRIERHWQVRELWGVFLARELGDEDELADAVRKLRAGPVLGAE